MLKIYSLLLFSLFSLQASNKQIAYCITEKSYIILSKNGTIQFIALHAVDTRLKELLKPLKEVKRAELIKMHAELT